jgi:ADP-ribose pyrophosphatase
MNLEEKQISSEEIFNGVAIHLFRDEILLPNGKKSVREVIRHPGAVCVLPLTEQGEIIFVNQFRYALGKVTLEVPAGKLEKGEDPMVAAMRELSEETGLDAKNVVPMGALYTTPALIDEIIYMYIATDLYQGEKHPDEDEFVDTVKIPLEKAVEMVMNGEIRDSKTQIIILKADKYFKEHK